MSRVIIVRGMKRSGNHAIINWLQAHDRFIFFNNIIKIRPILDGEKKLPSPKDFRQWLQKIVLANESQVCYFSKENVSEALSMKHSFIMSLEDHDLQIKPFINVPASHGIKNILILRDPCNLFASRIRKASLVKKDTPVYPKCMGLEMNRVVELWKSYAREYLGLTNHLENRVCIYFNSWFSNRDYRQSISRKLNMEFTDSGFSTVLRAGGGSSFDRTSFDGKNHMMDVLNRQKYLTASEQQLLKKVLADEELQGLAHRITQMNQIAI